MSASNRLLSLILAALGLSLATETRAGESLPFWATNATPRLQTKVVREGGPGLRTVNRAYINLGTNRFALIVPDGFRVDYSEPQRISLVSTDYTSVMTFSVSEPLPATGDMDGACRQLLMTRYPGSEVTSQFSLGAGGASGPAFDLRWKAQGGMSRRGWFGFMNSRAGLLEFDLVSSPDKFETVRPDFYFVLATFRQSDESGKLDVPQMSDKL